MGKCKNKWITLDFGWCPLSTFNSDNISEQLRPPGVFKSPPLLPNLTRPQYYVFNIYSIKKNFLSRNLSEFLKSFLTDSLRKSRTGDSWADLVINIIICNFF